MLVAHNTVHVVTYQEYSDGVGPSPKGGGGASPPPVNPSLGWMLFLTPNQPRQSTKEWSQAKRRNDLSFGS